MSPESASKLTKTCPTCGTRLNENATRCLVCGRNFTPLEHGSDKPVQSARMPEITLSLPIALGLMVIVLAIGAGVVFSVLRSTGRVVEPTATITPSLTATITLTEMPTLTPTPLPTFTPLHP